MKASPPRPRRPRAAYLAAPPLTRSDERAEGAEVLAEVPGAAGVLLFGALRDVMLWVQAPAAERGALFPAAAGEARRAALAACAPEQELWGPLLALARMAEAPAAAEAGRVAYACRAVARWAERAGAPGTRLGFAQAAALALPADPRLALETARLARDLARPAQAEGWFRAAIRLARGRDWESYAWGFIGLGVLYIRTGNFPAAQALMGRALRTGLKRGMRPVQGASHHYLFNLLADAGRLSEAYEHARAALEAYDGDPVRLPDLAHDLGRFWLLQRRFVRAAPVLAAAAPRLATAGLRMLATANLALAEAGAGDRSGYEGARGRALAHAAASADGSRVAETFWLLAQADAELQEWERAAEMAARSLALAAERGESEMRIQAAAVAERAAARRALAAPAAAENATSARLGERLVHEVVRTLAASAA